MIRSSQMMAEDNVQPTLQAVLSKVSLEESFELIRWAVPSGETLSCVILRSPSRSHTLRQYSLCVDSPDGRVLLLKARRRRSRGSTYVLSLDDRDFDVVCKNRSLGYAGKLRSQKGMGGHYVLYDAGLRPQSFKVQLEQRAGRRELASILYQPDALPNPRMVVALPALGRDGGKAVGWESSSRFPENNLGAQHLELEESGAWSGHHERLLLLQSRPDSYRCPKCCRALGTVAPSVKNFELEIANIDGTAGFTESRAKEATTVVQQTDAAAACATVDDDTAPLTLAKVGENRFLMVVRPPLTPLQAFGIALSRFDMSAAPGSNAKLRH